MLMQLTWMLIYLYRLTTVGYINILQETWFFNFVSLNITYSTPNENISVGLFTCKHSQIAHAQIPCLQKKLYNNILHWVNQMNYHICNFAVETVFTRVNSTFIFLFSHTCTCNVSCMSGVTTCEVFCVHIEAVLGRRLDHEPV